MLRNFLIFSLCFVAIRACGEFSVISTPKSLSFKGDEDLHSEYVGEIVSAAIGNPVAKNAQWNGLTVEDPFNMPKGVVVVFCNGINHLSLSSNAKTYTLKGDNADESLRALGTGLKESNIDVCDIDFTKFDEALKVYRSCFGEVAVPSVSGTKNLDPSTSTADKQFLQSVSLMNYAAENWAVYQNSNKYVSFGISLEPLTKEHGEKSAAFIEASKLVSSAIAKLNEVVKKTSKNQNLFVVVANKASGKRYKREAARSEKMDATKYNLAEYYNDDYPVIFNIILWFMVTFGLALLAICYAIGAMDPGRDSIIYRMTSTRMKKDN